MGDFLYKHIFLLVVLVMLVFLAGCSTNKFSKPDIKDDFCGVYINYQYCKCAFHKQYCDNIGMSKSSANTYVYAEYDAWVNKLFAAWKTECEADGGIVENDKCIQKEGVVEKDGKLYLNSKPGKTLEIIDEDLPGWARGKIATVGATIAVVGPPDVIIEGDSSVLLNGLPIARINDSTAHGGIIIEGSDKIFVNGRPVAIIGGYAVDPTVNSGTVPSVGGQIIAG